MSYCRMSACSDVYVLGTSEGLECCGCRLLDRRSFYCCDENQMLQHLDQHLLAGHRVPRRARQRLRAERDGIDWHAQEWNRYRNKRRHPRDLWELK